MIPYIVLFLITIVNGILIEILLKKKKNLFAKFIAIISAIIIALFAGLRDDNVGRDIEVYVVPLFKACLNNSFVVMLGSNIEPLFLLLLYFNAKIFSDYHLTLFIIEFIVVLSVYTYGLKNDRISFPFLIITFLFIFFNNTLVMMRQFVAIALIFVSLEYFKEKKYIKTLLLFVLARLFHDTAIIAVIMYVFLFLENNVEISKTKSLLLKLGIAFIVILVAFFGKEIIYFFTYDIAILPERFYKYFSSQYVNGGFYFSTTSFAFKIFGLFLAIFLNKIEKNAESNFAVTCLFTDLAIYMLSIKIEPILRLGYYFNFWGYLYVIPMFGKRVVTAKKYKPMFYYLILVLLFTYWWYLFIYSEGSTYPYTSEILKGFI